MALGLLMMPQAMQAQAAPWTVAAVPAGAVSVGTREVNGAGYLIVSNRSQAPVTVTLTITGLAGLGPQVTDFFTGAPVAAFRGTSFTVTLPANGLGSGTAVYRLGGTPQAARGLPKPTKLRTPGGTLHAP